MKVATIQDLRYAFSQIFKWLEEDETIKLTRRGKVIGTITPANSSPKQETIWPDLAARRKRLFPHKAAGKPMWEIVSEGRGERF